MRQNLLLIYSKGSLHYKIIKGFQILGYMDFKKENL